LYILHLVDQGKLHTNQVVHFSKEDLSPDTHSPLRDDHKGTPCDLKLKEVLGYAVGKSDNIACDKLFALAGGPKALDTYLHQLGVKDIGIGSDYTHMRENGIKANWSTPNAMALTLKKFYKGKILSDSSFSLLWDIMSTTTYAPDRLKGLLPKNAVVAHKTGTYYTDAPVLEALNDVGIVVLPNGKHYAIAVYTNNSSETPEITTHIISEISKAAWDYFSGRH
jgi:beta-lactamase class A